MSRRTARADYLDPIEIVEFTRFVADEVASGKYPFIRFTEQRWHQRIYRDPSIDVWLLSWLPEQGTTLHDHGGSAGGFTVVTGELTEVTVTDTGRRPGRRTGRLEETAHLRGQSVGFDHRRVHDVRNLGTEPAVSVHAYSPPLTSMTYYDVQRGKLVATSSLVTDDPEPHVPAREAS